jgi:hypothetical protein
MSKGTKLCLILAVFLFELWVLDVCLKQFNYPYFPGQAQVALVAALASILLAGAVISRIITHGRKKEEPCPAEETKTTSSEQSSDQSSE